MRATVSTSEYDNKVSCLSTCFHIHCQVFPRRSMMLKCVERCWDPSAISVRVIIERWRTSSSNLQRKIDMAYMYYTNELDSGHSFMKDPCERPNPLLRLLSPSRPPPTCSSFKRLPRLYYIKWYVIQWYPIYISHAVEINLVAQNHLKKYPRQFCQFWFTFQIHSHPCQFQPEISCTSLWLNCFQGYWSMYQPAQWQWMAELKTSLTDLWDSRVNPMHALHTEILLRAQRGSGSWRKARLQGCPLR